MDTTSTIHLTAEDRAVLTQRYEILEEVGRGGMGAVYRARHRMLDRQVAVKICLASGQAERFQREGQLLARIRSPHIVAVHDFERLPDGRMLLVMDWVEGSDLGKIVRNAKEPLPESRVLPWMRQVCEGMQAAAEQGIIHRDLKPSNILIDSQDSAWVADFGLARSVDTVQLTLTDGLMGTPHYMAPEQAEDPRQVDVRTDLYSFGATFYHVLTGRPPFQAETPFSVLFKHKTEPLISPQARNPMLSRQVSECLERCLAKSPRERFPTFRDVLSSLQSYSAETSPWRGSEELELHPYLEHYEKRRSLYLKDMLDPQRPDHYPLPQQRLVTIGLGNLADQRVDALVSSDDHMLSMGGGVSAALSAAAGPDLSEQAQQFVPVRPGRAVVTTAGMLPARFVLHAVTMSYGSKPGQSRVRPSRDLINEIMESCFYHADTLGVESIAFPLLGTGVGGFPRDVCLDTMFRFLVRKLTRGITTVREARVTLFPWRLES